MKLVDVYKLKPGITVWIWVVQLARGRWWPGSVERIRSIGGSPRVVVRFEFRRERGGAAVAAGVTTTAMRYLELRIRVRVESISPVTYRCPYWSSPRNIGRLRAGSSLKSRCSR